MILNSEVEDSGQLNCSLLVDCCFAAEKLTPVGYEVVPVLSYINPQFYLTSVSLSSVDFMSSLYKI